MICGLERRPSVRRVAVALRHPDGSPIFQDGEGLWTRHDVPFDEAVFAGVRLDGTRGDEIGCGISSPHGLEIPLTALKGRVTIGCRYATTTPPPSVCLGARSVVPATPCLATLFGLA